MALVNSSIYNRFGTFVASKEKNSVAYKALVTKLIEFYVNLKSIHRIETILNVIDGLPFSRRKGEVISYIRPVTKDFNAISSDEAIGWIEIRTNFNTYHALPHAEILVEEGQVLNNNELLARLYKVDDYISDPDWCDGARFPFELVAGYSENYRRKRAWRSGTPEEQRLYAILNDVLKYNIIYVESRIDLNYSICINKSCQAIDILQDALPVYIFPLIDSELW
jgi:hypothetical protein